MSFNTVTLCNIQSIVNVFIVFEMFSGKYILPIEPSKEQIYPLKLKGISICFSTLKAALCGNYVNFGVFRLYGDETLENALKTFIKLLLCIPRNGLLVKLSFSCAILK